jgi:hypothetical protein
MMFTNNNILNGRNLCVVVCLVFGTLNGVHAQTLDINKIWTTVGSAGTVDEADASKIFFDRSIAQFGNVGGVIGGFSPASTASALTQQTASAVIRYNVTPVAGLFAAEPPCFTQTGNSCPGIQLRLRYLAAGNSGRVVARLIEVDMATGTEVTRLSFDSNAFAKANSYQVQSVGECGPQIPRQPFDFGTKAYYIEARLTIGGIVVGSAAGVQIIKVANIRCIG